MVFRRLRSAAAPALLIVASLALFLAAAEGALRLAGFSYPSFFVPDSRLGSRLRPGIEGWSVVEGRAYVKVNSAGMRDRERTPEKPPGTLRIAVLGDSFTEAAQVAVEDVFTAVLERKLAACSALAGKRAEVLNFGVSNYGTAQQLLLLRERVWGFAPDVVLLAFFVGNDVHNNSKELEGGRNRPFFVLKDGALELDASFAEHPAHRRSVVLAERLAPLQHLRLYQLARRARAGAEALRPDAALAFARGTGAAPLTERGLDENVLRPPPDARWQEAWRITEKLIETMHAEVSARGARFLVATIAAGASAYPDRTLRSRYAAHLGVPDLFYPEHRIAALGKARRFPVLNTGPILQRAADASGRFLYGFANARLGFGHWNEEGHALAGESIAAFVCASA